MSRAWVNKTTNSAGSERNLQVILAHEPCKLSLAPPWVTWLLRGDCCPSVHGSWRALHRVILLVRPHSECAVPSTLFESCLSLSSFPLLDVPYLSYQPAVSSRSGAGS